MDIPADVLEKLLEHEMRYFAFAAEAERTACAWYLHCDSLPGYQDVNRALRLRDDGRGPEAVVRDVLTHFRARNLPIVVDLDAMAEEQGIGPALRRLGVMPAISNRVWMHYPHQMPPTLAAPGVEVREIAQENVDEVRLWVGTNLDQDDSQADPDYWRYTEWEARYPLCRLYLGLLEGQPAGTCDLFAEGGWGRIEMVDTRIAFRRRGVASTLVAKAVADSLTMEHSKTYLFTDAGGEGERVYTRLGFVRLGVNVLRRHLQD
jgi:hypothetical protein